MSVLWTAGEAEAATGGQATGDWSVSGITTDRQALSRGDLFIDLYDAGGAALALEGGAGAAMVSHRPKGLAPEAPLLVVDQVRAGLDALGRAARARSQAKVVAVTGSDGKTSTAGMLATMLSGQKRTHTCQMDCAAPWGVSLTLAGMPPEAEIAIVEIGVGEPGAVSGLTRIARPDVAMVTNVSAAQMEAFPDGLDGIAREKGAIFAGLGPDGVAVLDGDLDVTPILVQAAGKARVLRFGTEAGNDLRLTRVDIVDDTTVAQADVAGELQLFRLAAAGRHFAMNALGALGVVQALGLDVTLAARALSGWHPPAGRGTRERILLDAVEDLSVELIDDAANANPSSVEAALEVLAAARPTDGQGRIAQGRRIVVLGDMLNLGAQEVALHEALAGLSWIAALDTMHCVGPLMRVLWERLPADKQGIWCETASEMAARIHHLIDAGDILLVKGSEGSQVSLVVDAVRKLGQAPATDTKG